jgi:glycosyltransferase involved in cell wall biosynthesis
MQATADDSTPTRPFWSVIVPLFDRREFLQQCLDSILDQDPGADAMEILVVDDASPIELRGFVHGLGRGRVTYIKNAENLGLYPSTNRAIRMARGRWLHILHDDDWVLPGFYAAMREAVETAPESVGVALCMYSNWDERYYGWWTPQPFAERAGLLGRDFVIRLAQACPLNLPAVIYRREIFERAGYFREDLPCTADWEWYVRSALQCDWHFQPETLACYRVHRANQSHQLAQTGQNARDVRKTLEIFAQTLPEDLAREVLPAAQEYHAGEFLKTALTCYQLGNQPHAREFLSAALAIDPHALEREGFAELLRHPAAKELREQIRSALLGDSRL